MRPMIEGPTCARIRQLLAEGPMTAFTVEAVVGVCYSVALRNLRVLHKAREVHISGWWRGAAVGPWAPIWSLGRGKDAPKPEPVEHAEYQRRRRQDPSVRMDEMMSKRKARAAKSVRP